MMTSYLTDIVKAQKEGEAKGIASICSANPFVIEAALRYAPADEPVLIESTCNQVNQFGGYTGMKPVNFRRYVFEIADKVGFPHERIILGGDHLGPNPWQAETAVFAMQKSKTMMREYVAAGYTKIHLDASMKCGDDDVERPLSKAISAARAADMAVVAEATRAQTNGASLHYIIGTEVPIPGGAQEEEDHISVTQPDDVAETIEISKQAFLEQGLDAAWERVIAVVVQSGVEFGGDSLFEYDSMAAAELVRFIESNEQLIYEAHSTDYQTRTALQNLVRDHFAILKVGPGLTFAFREAVFALESIEEEWLGSQPNVELSQVQKTLETAMLENPVHWQKYYLGNDAAQSFARRYSFSDRSRYYWPVLTVSEALENLFSNLSKPPIPLTLLSQFLPAQYEQIRQGALENSPQAIVMNKIAIVLADYEYDGSTLVKSP